MGRTRRDLQGPSSLTSLGFRQSVYLSLQVPPCWFSSWVWVYQLQLALKECGTVTKTPISMCGKNLLSVIENAPGFVSQFFSPCILNLF